MASLRPHGVFICIEGLDGCGKTTQAKLLVRRLKPEYDAVYTAYSLAKPGDTVILSPACASFDMFRDYAERGMIFMKAVEKIVEAEQ